jgi:hypothetical protein
MDQEREIQDLLDCDRLRGLQFTWVEPDEVQLPYRELLCHDRDMTSTLSRFHGGAVELSVFQEPSADDCYVREVLLKVGGKPVEYGLIRIHLEKFPEGMRAEILAREKPLGRILNESDFIYTSEPGGFLKIPSSTFQPGFFPSASSKFLFGRYNTLLDARRNVLARIIEILPFEHS